MQNKMQTSHVCLCHVSVSVTNCEIRLACWSNPCENGGTCVEYVDSYNCTCPANWIGSHCKTEDADGIRKRTKAAIAMGALAVTATIGGIVHNSSSCGES